MIAKELDEDLDLIKIICQAAGVFAPEYEEEKVFEEFYRIQESSGD